MQTKRKVGEHMAKTFPDRLAQRKLIMELYEAGWQKRAIANRLGCHETNIGRIINRVLLLRAAGVVNIASLPKRKQQ